MSALVKAEGSDDKLAAKIGQGVTRQMVIDWRLGRREPNATNRARLASVEGTDPEEWHKLAKRRAERQQSLETKVSSLETQMFALAREVAELQEAVREVAALARKRGQS